MKIWSSRDLEDLETWSSGDLDIWRFLKCYFSSYLGTTLIVADINKRYVLSTKSGLGSALLLSDAEHVWNERATHTKARFRWDLVRRIMKEGLILLGP